MLGKELVSMEYCSYLCIQRENKYKYVVLYLNYITDFQQTVIFESPDEMIHTVSKLKLYMF